MSLRFLTLLSLSLVSFASQAWDKCGARVTGCSDTSKVVFEEASKLGNATNTQKLAESLEKLKKAFEGGVGSSPDAASDFDGSLTQLGGCRNSLQAGLNEAIGQDGSGDSFGGDGKDNTKDAQGKISASTGMQYGAGADSMGICGQNLRLAANQHQTCQNTGNGVKAEADHAKATVESCVKNTLPQVTKRLQDAAKALNDRALKATNENDRKAFQEAATKVQQYGQKVPMVSASHRQIADAIGTIATNAGTRAKSCGDSFADDKATQKTCLAAQDSLNRNSGQGSGGSGGGQPSGGQPNSQPKESGKQGGEQASAPKAPEEKKPDPAAEQAKLAAEEAQKKLEETLAEKKEAELEALTKLKDCMQTAQIVGGVNADGTPENKGGENTCTAEKTAVETASADVKATEKRLEQAKQDTIAKTAAAAAGATNSGGQPLASPDLGDAQGGQRKLASSHAKDKGGLYSGTGVGFESGLSPLPSSSGEAPKAGEAGAVTGRNLVAEGEGETAEQMVLEKVCPSNGTCGTEKVKLAVACARTAYEQERRGTKQVCAGRKARSKELMSSVKNFGTEAK